MQNAPLFKMEWYELQGKYDKALEYLRMVKPVNDEQRVLNCLNYGV